MFLSILIFIFILGLLVFAHELGHFLVAKRRGVKVEEFGFGFPPRLFSFKKGETVYSVNLIPLGGFVKVFGETESVEPASPEESTPAPSEGSFAFRPLWERAMIVAAGVAGNVLLAWVLLSIGNTVGVPSVLEDGEGAVRNTRIVVTDVAGGSPAEAAGIAAGDAILKIGESAHGLQAVQTIESVQTFINGRRGERITLVLESSGRAREVEAVPRESVPAGEGALGIAMVRTGLVSYPWYEAIGRGASATVEFGWAIIRGFGMVLAGLFAEGRLTAEVAGPVGIALLSQEALTLGVSYLIFFTALLSLNLAFINILPFPALDGGRLLFLAIEWLKGSPVSRQAERLAHTAGFAFLMGLMAVVTYRDVLRLVL